MELDELKTLWQETNRRLEALEPALRLSQRLARAKTLDRMRSKLWFVRLILWYEVGFGILAVLLAGSYLGSHIGTIRFAIPAVTLHLGAIALLGFAARQLVALSQIDYAGPIVDIQRRLAELGIVRARANRWLLFTAPLLWAVLIIVVPHGLLGLDVYRAFGPIWIASNFLFGLAVLAAGAWATRRFPAATFLRWLGEDLTGRKVAAASGFLDDIAAFETEG